MAKNIVIDWIVPPEMKSTMSAMQVVKLEVKTLKQSHGLLDEKEKDFASVEVHHQYNIETPKGIQKKEAIKKIFGAPNAVYQHCIKYYPSNRINFKRAWNIAKEKNLSSLLITPFKPAYTGEKIFDNILETFNGDPKRFAEAAGKDVGNVYNEIKGSRKISIQQAIEYSKILNCDPVDLLFEKTNCKIWGHVDFKNTHYYNTLEEDEYQINVGEIAFYSEKETQITEVPRNIWRPDIHCINVKSPGSFLHNHNLFYYKSKDNKDHNCHGKLIILGREIYSGNDLEYVQYMCGIYEENLTGDINLYNPDPMVSDKLIAEKIKNINFVAPVVAVVNPNLIKLDDARQTFKNFEKISDTLNKEYNETRKFIGRYGFDTEEQIPTFDESRKPKRA